MLALALPIISAASDSDPGRSRISTRMRASRPARTMPRSITAASNSGSMFPPDSTSPTRLPRNGSRVAQHRRQRRRARPLDHGLLHLQQQQHRLLQIPFVHQHHVLAARAG